MYDLSHTALKLGDSWSRCQLSTWDHCVTHWHLAVFSPKAGLRLSTYTTKLADYRCSRRYSLSGSCQLDFVVYDTPDAVVSDSKKWIGYEASWQSERTHDAQLIVWAVLADGIGNRKTFAGFLLGVSPHARRSVNKLLACLIHAFLSFLLSSYSVSIPSLIAPVDV